MGLQYPWDAQTLLSHEWLSHGYKEQMALATHFHVIYYPITVPVSNPPPF
jgi:hypothetical protein